MSRLDQHVAAVRNKLALVQFVDALARTLLVLGAVVWTAVLIDKFFRLRLPHQMIWMSCALAASLAAALVLTIARRPSREAAAVAIDQKLGLKEKLSTALIRALKQRSIRAVGGQ